MTSVQQIARVCVFLSCVAVLPAVSVGQEDQPYFRGLGGPFTVAPVLDAPFSADAAITFRRTLAKGEQVEQRATARYYRDAAGQVRAEWVDTGLSGQYRSAGRFTSIWIAPADGRLYLLDLVDQSVRYIVPYLAKDIFSGGNAFRMPLGIDRYRHFFDPWDAGPAQEVMLGARRIEGVHTTGLRLTRPLKSTGTEMVEERWASPELKVVIASRQSDTAAGASVDYRLTNISRAEPPADLFVVQREMLNYSTGHHNQDERGSGWLISLAPCLIGCQRR